MTQTLIQKYIEIIAAPNKCGGGFVSILQKERVAKLEEAKKNPTLKRDVRTGDIYVKIQEKEWLNLSSPEYCLIFSTIVEKYPEFYIEL